MTPEQLAVINTLMNLNPRPAFLEGMSEADLVVIANELLGVGQ